MKKKRTNKEIGSSLEAEIEITTDSKIFNLLEGLDLAEYFITSKAKKIKSKEKNELIIKVKKTSGTKCLRCWKILDDHCQRCQNVTLKN